MEYQEFLTDVLREASAIAIEKFGRVCGVTKEVDNNQVLTEADLAIGQLLIERITSAFPGDNIIDEEKGVIDRGSDRTWVVDPIDGTSNFASGVPTYGIMVGLLQRTEPVAGGIALPAFDEICTAARGEGAFCNRQKIAVTREENLLRTLVAYGIDGHQKDPESTRRETRLLTEIILNIRNLRTSNSVFDTVLVARGQYGALLNRTSKIWDNVGQQVILEEAGGVYTEFFGEKMDYSHPLRKAEDNFTFCAAAPVLHRKLQEIIRRAPL